MNASDASDTGYAWAEHLMSMEAGAEASAWTAPAEPGRLRLLAPGVLASAALGAVAIGVSAAPIWPFTTAEGRHPFDPILLVMGLGMLLAYQPAVQTLLRPGLTFMVKSVLPVGIVLLGAKLDLRELVAIGAEGVGASVLWIAAAVAVSVLLGRMLGLSTKLALLLGVGTGVCGGSAIVATAPAIAAEDDDVLLSVAAVALIGLVLMFALPVVGQVLGLPEATFGFWAGLTIHQTPQVLAAGFAYGPEAAETATLVKLSRIALLVPVVFLAGWWFRRSDRATTSTPSYRSMIPGFVLGLLAVVALRTLGLLPELAVRLPEASLFGAAALEVDLAELGGTLSKLCILAAMAAIGLQTRLDTLQRAGLRPLAAGGLVAVLLCGVSLLALVQLA